MNSEMALWDQVSLGIVLFFVVLYIALKIKKMLSPSSSGCGGCSCSSGACSVRPMGNDKDKPSITVDAIQKNIIVK